MNKVLIGWNVLLTALLGFLFFDNNGVSSTEAENLQVEKKVEMIDSLEIEIPNDLAKVVFINNDTLFKKYEMYIDLQDELLAEKLRLENQYKREVEKLEKEYLDLREKAPFMTQAQGEAAQAELMQKQQGLVQMERELTLKLGKKENELVVKIKKSIEEYLNRMQEEYDYDFVLGKSNMGGIHFANTERDITSTVLVGLNQEYLAKKEIKTKK